MLHRIITDQLQRNAVQFLEKKNSASCEQKKLATTARPNIATVIRAVSPQKPSTPINKNPINEVLVPRANNKEPTKLTKPPSQGPMILTRRPIHRTSTTYLQLHAITKVELSKVPVPGRHDVCLTSATKYCSHRRQHSEKGTTVTVTEERLALIPPPKMFLRHPHLG